MSVFKLFLILAAFCFAIFVVNLINKYNLLATSAIKFLLIAAVTIIFSIFEGIPTAIASFLGFEVTSNFIFFVAIMVLFLESISNTIEISNQRQLNAKLVQELSLLKSEVKKGDKRC